MGLCGTAGCPAASATPGGCAPVAAPRGHVLPRVGQQVDLGACVVVPKGHNRLVQEAIHHVTGPAYDLRRRLVWARTGQHVQAHVLSRILGQLRAEGLRGCEPRGPCAYKVRAACAPSAVLRRRSVMEGGLCPLLASAPASGSPARSSSTKRVPPYPWCLRARRTSSSVASAGVRKPFSGIACRGVCCRGCGLGSSLD